MIMAQKKSKRVDINIDEVLQSMEANLQKGLNSNEAASLKDQYWPFEIVLLDKI